MEAINVEAAREKSIRHGHSSTWHLWWALRSLAACRAVLVAQMVAGLLDEVVTATRDWPKCAWSERSATGDGAGCGLTFVGTAGPSRGGVRRRTLAMGGAGLVAVVLLVVVVMVRRSPGRRRWSGRSPAAPLDAEGIPGPAAAAYEGAAMAARGFGPPCEIPAAVVAGVGEVESGHGTYGGGAPGVDGVTVPIFGG